MTTLRQLFGLLATFGAFSVQAQIAAPEAASGWTKKSLVTARQAMVATAHPLASKIALDTLKRGGSALDAAIAAQMMLGLVEPQSSGIGGGAFLLYFDARKNKVHAWDGREKAPYEASSRLFYASNGKPLPFHEAIIGGRAVGAPGLVRMLEQAHARHGALPWSSLILPAAEQAELGFPMGARLHSLLRSERFLKLDPEAASYFYLADGSPKPIGAIVQNPQLAQTMRSIARDGALAMASGPIAQAIVDKVQIHPSNPGVLQRRDLIAYQALERQAICSPYLHYRLCGMPPPSSGGIAVAQILGILEQAKAPTLTANSILSTPGVHAFAQASRLAFADRNAFIADPEFAPTPPGLLSQQYLKSRASLLTVGQEDLRQSAPAGTPNISKLSTPATANILSYPESGTTHISIIDKFGNAVSMTSTIEDQFGARQWVKGFLLNNQLSDFSFLEREDQQLIANRVEPGKRPRSSMAPTLVFDQHGRLVLSTGSPGGAAIIPYVAKVLTAHLRDGLDIQEAINLPNIGNRNGPTELERDRIDTHMVEQLKALGHNLRLGDMTSGIQGIAVRHVARGRVLSGGADPRREGLVLGY